MTVPARVYDLVERFDRNRETYLSNYNETQLRGDFLDPLLEELGWDVHNRQGHPEAYRQVIEEDKLKIGGGTKAPESLVYFRLALMIVKRVPMMECPGCGRTFVPESGKQKYCTKSCASTSRWRRWKERQDVPDAHTLRDPASGPAE